VGENFFCLSTLFVVHSNPYGELQKMKPQKYAGFGNVSVSTDPAVKALIAEDTELTRKLKYSAKISGVEGETYQSDIYLARLGLTTESADRAIAKWYASAEGKKHMALLRETAAQLEENAKKAVEAQRQLVKNAVGL
jgi:hypothetical protein